MNITGSPNYSKELTAIRNPVNNLDTLKKLVFIYPTGIDQSIINKTFSTAVKGDDDTLGDLSRAFLSVSVLKEIFTSNALNLITLATTYKQQNELPSSSQQMIGSLLRGDTSNKYDINIYNNKQTVYNPVDTNVLQTKINEKVSQIKKILKNNPRLKKLNPFMEVITLNNLLDVPVIVGTWPFQLDTASLFMLLATAIATRTSLDEWGKVRQLFSKLKSMPDSNFYDIFKVLTNVESNNNIPQTANSESLPGGILSQYDRLQSELSQETDENKKTKLLSQFNKFKDDYAFKAIGELKDTKVKELERNFMLMLDLDRLASKYGLSSEISQARYLSKKVKPQTEILFNRTKQQYLDFLAGIDSYLSSIYMIFSPITPDGVIWNESTMNYLSLKEQIVNYASDNFDNFFKSLKLNFETTIEQSLESSEVSIKSMMKSCDVAREEFISLMTFFNKMVYEAQIPATFDESQLEKYTTNVDKIISKFMIVNKQTKSSLDQFFGQDGAIEVYNAMSVLINNTIDKYFQVFQKTKNPNTNIQARLYAININNPDFVTLEFHQRLLNMLMTATKTIFETVFLLIFKINLCDFVEVADVELDIIKNDVLDLPNYCLVLPLEIINALFILYTKRNWKDAVLKSGSGFNPLNMSNVKGIIRTLSLQLGIPNLIVIDQNRNEMFYSFRYLGNQVEKLKLNAVNTYVKYHLTNDKEGVSQLYY